MATDTLFGQATPGGVSSGAGNAGTNGLHFTVSTASVLNGIWHYSPSGSTQLPAQIGLYTITTLGTSGTLVTSETASWSGAAGSGWVLALFASPPTLVSGTDYMATQWRNDAVNEWFSIYTISWPVSSGIITAPNDVGGGQGWYNNTSFTSMVFPTSQLGGDNFGMDVSVSHIAVDASTPAVVDLNGSTATTATTASFSPPAGSLVLIVVEIGLQGTSAEAVSVADSLSNSYSAGPSEYAFTANGVFFFQFYYAAAPGSITVTATRSSGSVGNFTLIPQVLTGTAASQAGAAAPAGVSGSATTPMTSSITPTAIGSWVVAATSSSAASGTAVGLTDLYNVHDGTDGVLVTQGYAVTSALTSETVGWTPNAAAFWAWAAIEILPVGASGGTPPYSGTNATLGTPAIPGQAQPGNFIPGQVNFTATSLTVNAGLATATGTAQSPKVTATVSATLATGTGVALPPGTAKRSTGLATASGTAQQPTVTLTVNAGLATGTGTAQSPFDSLTITAGLATGTGTAFAPGTARTAGLATGTGTSQPPLDSITVSAGLATGTGTSQAPAVSLEVNAGIATGVGTSFGVTIPAGAVAAGLATGAGTALSPTVTLTVNAGLATGTGTAFAPGTARTAGLATGTGTSQQPSVTLVVNATLAAATGTAFAPGTGARTAGFATGSGIAQQPTVTATVNATLAHGTGTAQSPLTTLAINAGLATGTSTSQSPAPTAKLTAGLATATGTSFDITQFVFVRHNVDYTGSTLTDANTLGGTISIAALDGTASVNANTLGGTVSVNNSLGGTISVFTLGGTASVTSDTLTGTLSVVVNALSGTDVTDKMQEVDIILNEYNDATVTFQIKDNGSPDDITGMTVNALFKKLRGDLDSAGTTTTYSSAGGSPAITIVTPSTGSCTLAIPHTDVIFPNWTFYRIDVVNGTVTTTAIFGTVTITQL